MRPRWGRLYVFANNYKYLNPSDSFIIVTSIYFIDEIIIRTICILIPKELHNCRKYFRREHPEPVEVAAIFYE